MRRALKLQSCERLSWVRLARTLKLKFMFSPLGHAFLPKLNFRFKINDVVDEESKVL